VHGSTYPAHTGFDIPLGGSRGWSIIASRGYDVYCLDVRGYGRSTRPKAMATAAEQSAGGADAGRGEGHHRGAELHPQAPQHRQTQLLGWSWGCTLMATTAIQNPDKTARLMLYAPGCLRTTPSPLAGPARSAPTAR
jgi:pimeloyl-ACP methyl ester carboxylesterase